MESTRQHHEAITRFLDRTRRRERRQLVALAIMRLLILFTWISVVAAMGLSYGIAPVAVALGSIAAAALLGSLWIAGPVRRRWVQSRSRLHQAHCVEARLPGLRGRLVTVIDHGLSADVQSPALLGRAAHHAKRATEIVTVSDIHPSRQSKRAAGFAFISVLCAALMSVILAIGPMDAISVLLGSSVSSLRLSDSTMVEHDDSELVGDISLRYVFPDYTGLEPREIPTSDGTIIAPPGTEVQIRARSAIPFDAAAIQVGDKPPVDATLTDGRDVSGSIIVTTSSTWKVLLFDDRNVSTSKDFELRVEADSPPVVVISEVGQSVVPVDAPLGLSWNVTDDYGVVRVSVELTTDDEVETFVRREPIDPLLELSGTERATPRDLGLTPGDSVTLRVVAVDNDKANGGNRGESEALVLEVLGPRGYGKNLARYHEELRDAMLDALADFLEEPVPPAATRQGLIKWAASAPSRLDPMREVFKKQWGGQTSSGLDGDLVTDILEASARLFRFTIMTFDQAVGSGGPQPVAGDVDTFMQLHDQTVVSLETAAFVIDSMLRQVGVAELARQAAKVARTAGDLADRAENGEEVDALQAALDRLERQLNQLTEAAAQLSDESLSEFTDAALQQAGSLLSEVRQALSDGREADAKDLMAALAEQLAQLAESLNDREQRQQAQQGETMERFEALMKDLETLSTDQVSLAEKLAKKQNELGAGFTERMQIWEQLDALATEFAARGEQTLSAVGDGRLWSAYTIRRLSDLANLTSGALDSVRARDSAGSARRVDEAGFELPITRRFVERELSQGNAPEGVNTALAGLERLAKIHQAMKSLLDQLRDTAGESNPELEAATRALAEEQGELQDRQRELAEEVRLVENALPVATGDASRAMKEAGGEMESARQALDVGIAISAEGHQRRADDRIRETREHLQQSMEKQSEMQRSMEQMQGQRRAESGDERGDSPPSSEPEIPAPEMFQTAEAYREALLEGMAGDVPEEFKALKRRFYEDLVRQ